MKQITKPADNLGGLLKVWAVPNSVISVNGKDVSFSNSDNIYAIYCSAETMDLKEQAVTTDAGTHYNTDITGFIPANREEVLDAMKDMQSKPFRIIIQDGNGDYLLAGNQSCPLRLQAILKSGTNTSDLAGYQIHFSGETISRAGFINNPF